MAHPTHAVFFALVPLFGVSAACSLDSGVEPEAEVPGVRAPFRIAVGDEPCPGEDADTREARRAIAQARAMVGLPALRCDTAASEAARGHCGYLIANNELSHFQTKGKPAFTGVSFEDRLASQRFRDQPAGEVLANITGAAAVAGPRGFLNSVYHRAPFLRSETASFGYGHVDTCATIDFGRRNMGGSFPDRIVSWPPDGAQNVPGVFHSGAERPNPLPGTTVTGAPVSILAEVPLVGLRAEIAGPEGTLRSVLITHESDPAHLVRVGEAHLLPREPLSPYTHYTARFWFRTNGQPVQISTSFITGGE